MNLLPSDLGLPPKFTSFRQEVKQESIILSLALSNKRVSILNAPPGSGKGIIYYSISKLLSARTLILTPLKTLEDQLLNDFKSSGLFGIRGHSNYSCATVYSDDEELFDLECSARRNGNCTYKKHVDLSISSPEVVTNLAHWTQLYKSEDPNRLGYFDLLVIDEAHSIRKLLTDYISIKLYNRTINKYLECDLLNYQSDKLVWSEWLKYVIPKARQVYKKLANEKANKRDILIVTQLGKNLTRIENELVIRPDNWLITQHSMSNVEFSPIDVSYYVEEYLFRNISRILLTSATISEADSIDLGLKSDEFDYYEIDSSFPIERRPLIYIPTSPKIKVDHRMTVGERRIWANRIDSIISGRLDRKGIIQTRSYDRKDDILDLSKYNFLMIDFSRGKFRLALDKYKRSGPPCILIGPSMEEGLDLPFELCLYLIIAKLPFLDGRDPMIQVRSQLDKSYKDREVARTLVQMSLRGMRSKEDYCEIFFTDANITWLLFGDRTKNLFPKYYTSAFKQLDKVPEPLLLQEIGI